MKHKLSLVFVLIITVLLTSCTQKTNDLKADTTSIQENLPIEPQTKPEETHPILTSKENCNFNQKEIDDLTLSVEQLPEEFQEKNSWGEWKYGVTPEIKYDLYAQVLTAPYDSNVSIASLRFSNAENGNSYTEIGYAIIEFDDAEKARDAFKYSKEDAMTNENIKQDSGSYGDEDYEYYNDFGYPPYVISFRKDRFVFSINTRTANKEKSESIAIKLANEFQKNICEN